jgi:hypothetical protein
MNVWNNSGCARKTGNMPVYWLWPAIDAAVPAYTASSLL